MTTIYTASHVHMQCELPPAPGPCDPTLQQLSTPQPKMQPQHGTDHRHHISQVQLPNQQTTINTPIQPSEHHQYNLSFPALPAQNKTPWTKVEYKKRPRDIPESHTTTTKQPTLNDYWLNQPSPFNTNKFAVLTDEGMEEEQTSTQQTTPRPPPIFVAGVQNIQPLHELLVTIARDDFELKVLQNNQVKIQPKSSDKYTTIIKALAEKHTEFHTYQPKADRSFRTVLRGLHYSTDTQDIKAEIESHGHTVVNIFNIKQIRTNSPLPLFFVDLKPSINNTNIYLITTLLYTKVKFEPPRPKRTIPQCSKCQRYGHTQAYCFHSPRCVKCAGSHHTSQCLRKDKSDSVKCVLCNGNHPANYKGCTIYKDLQKRTFPPLRRKQDAKHPYDLPKPQATTASSYASALKSSPIPPSTTDFPPQQINTHQQHLQPPQTDLQELKNTMKKLMEQMGIMLNLLTTLVSKLT